MDDYAYEQEGWDGIGSTEEDIMDNKTPQQLIRMMRGGCKRIRKDRAI